MIQRKLSQISYIRRAKSLLIVLVLFLNVLCLLCCTKTKDVPSKTSSSQSVTKSNGRFVDPDELYDEEDLRFALEDAYDKCSDMTEQLFKQKQQEIEEGFEKYIKDLEQKKEMEFDYSKGFRMYDVE